MATPDLIDRLVADLKPVPPAAVARRIGAGLVVGVAVSAVLMKLMLGIRPDLAEAAATGAFWMKFAYTAVLAGLGTVAILRMARPGGRPRGAAIATAIVVLAFAALALIQFSLAPTAARGPLVMGASANVCPWNIVILSVPVFIGAFWSLRGLAPTRLTLAGAVAGLFAGAFGALVYSFHCDESGMPFVAIWYTAGIVIPGLAGALLGRLMLRW
jgi:hypothetical protein